MHSTSALVALVTLDQKFKPKSANEYLAYCSVNFLKPYSFFISKLFNKVWEDNFPCFIIYIQFFAIDTINANQLI